VFIVVSAYFVIDSARKLLDTPSYNRLWDRRLGFHFRKRHYNTCFVTESTTNSAFCSKFQESLIQGLNMTERTQTYLFVGECLSIRNRNKIFDRMS